MPQPQQDENEYIQGFLAWQKSEEVLRKGYRALDGGAKAFYVPFRSLETYLGDRQRLKHILKAIFPEGHSLNGEYIREHYLRILAILISIGQGRMILQFMKTQKMQDTYLPFNSQDSGFPQSSGYDLPTRFCEHQWRFCPPKMVRHMEYSYEENAILPFRVEDFIEKGGSAHIFRICVDEDYNQLYQSHNESKNTFVLKTFHGPEARKYYDAEKQGFQNLNSGTIPPNIIGFFGTFVQKETYHMILEYADGGTLEEYMEKEPPDNGKDILAFWENVLKLIAGLLKIHNTPASGESDVLLGWHQDIKPDNILIMGWNPSSPYNCQFVLADLGLSHFKRALPTQLDASDVDTWGTHVYGAPESSRTGPVSKSTALQVTPTVDIWSLGCVLSECATWVVFGRSKLKEYRRQRANEVHVKCKRKLGEIFHDNEDTLAAVQENHSLIRSSCRKDDFITTKVLDELVEKMIVKERGRISAKNLEFYATRIIEEGRGELENYMPTPSAGLPPPIMQLHNQLNGLGLQAGHTKSDTSSERTENASSRSDSDGHCANPKPQEADESSQRQVQKDSNEDARNPPRISVAEMLRWKREKFFGIAKDLPGQPTLKVLDGREAVFIVDDSESMAPHKKDVRNVLEATAYAIKRYDHNGVDLLFTQSDRKVTKCKKTKVLLAALEEVEFKANPDMEIELGRILQEYRDKWTGNGRSWVKKKLRSALLGKPRPLSLYIFTDGIWNDCDVESKIRSMVEFLTEHDLIVKQVAIQFIRFGNASKEAEELLDRLDDGLNLELDIVDHTPANGNVWKMILGAHHTWFDKDNRPMTA